MPDYLKLVERIARLAKLILGEDKLKAFVVTNNKKSKPAINDGPV